MSSESGAEKDGRVMEDPSGCLADKTANLSTRPSRIRKGEDRIRDFPLGIIIAGLHRLVKREPTYQNLPRVLSFVNRAPSYGFTFVESVSATRQPDSP